MKRPGGFDRTPEDDAPPARESTPRARDPRISRFSIARRLGARDADPANEATHLPVPERGGTGADISAERDSTAGTGGAEIAAGVDVAAGVEVGAEAEVGAALDPSSASETDALSHERQETAVLARFESRAPDPIRAAKQHLRRAQRSVRSRERREQRRFTAHARRRRLNWLIAGGAVLVLGVFVAVGVLSPLTAVREVRIAGAEQVDVAAIEQAMQRFEGRPLALVQETEVHRALEPFPLIQRYSIERIPPHTLVIRLQERDGVIAVPRGKKFDVFDPAGVRVGTMDTARRGVPVASGRVKTTGSPAFTAAAHVVRDMPADIRKKLVGVTAKGDQDVAFELANGRQVVWGDVSETQRKAVVLRALMKAAKSASVYDVSAPDAPVFR